MSIDLRNTVFRFALMVGLCVSGLAIGGQQIELIGISRIPGIATDLSRETTELENGTPHNRLGGFSALEYTGQGNRFAALPDRGPDDGATEYLCRFQLLDINVDYGAIPPVHVELVGTVMLKDQSGRHFTGSASVLKPGKAIAGRLDPEGFRFGSPERFFVTDEYGPQLIEFSTVGNEIRRLPLPSHLLVEHPADSKQVENEQNVRGRASNKGMEGLAVSSDGRTLTGIMQHVLLQDGKRQSDGKPEGINCRMVQIDVESGACVEFVYQLDSPRNGLNEIVAFGSNEFLVIERDGLTGNDAEFKRIMKINVAGATNVLDLQQLPPADLPKTIRPVRKQVFIDFLAPCFHLSEDQIPEKLEGLTMGPALSDGRRTLLVASDNDFEADVPSLIYVFAIPQH